MKRVLIVDDDATLRMALTRYLEKRGYGVQNAGSGAEALQVFEQDPPDLVVSDVMMAEMDGYEFCRRLRSIRAGQLVPFIFLSSRSEIDARVQGHSMGADDYLIKPFEPKELLAKIEAQLERSRRFHAELVRLMQLSPELPSPEQQPASTAALPLTPAEAKVFWEVVRGLTNKQIGDRLFISPRTVQTHLSNILSKLELENRSQLVRFAFEHGFKPPAESVAPRE